MTFLTLTPSQPRQCAVRHAPVVALASRSSKNQSAASNIVGAWRSAADRLWRGQGQGTSRAERVRRGLPVAAGFGGAAVLARRMQPLPVVLLHGILDKAQNMEESATWVREALPGAYVVTLEVGNGIVDSISRPMEWQLEQLVRAIRADRKLRRGFHFIGHSQGSLLARAYVQRCAPPHLCASSPMRLLTYAPPHLCASASTHH